MQRFDRDQIVRFLRALDDALEEKLELFVVGGLAVILKYDAPLMTADMDVFAIVSGSESDLKHAARVATDLTGIVFLIGTASVAELPWNYEERTKKVNGLRFRKLAMIVPDKYDLALSKTVRGDQHDLDAIAAMHAQHPLSEKTLVHRFENDLWKIAVGDSRRLAFHMVHLVEALYGAKRADFYRKRWRLDRPPGSTK